MINGMLPIQLKDTAVREYMDIGKQVNGIVLEEVEAKEQAEEFINFINYLLVAGKDNTKQDEKNTKSERN